MNVSRMAADEDKTRQIFYGVCVALALASVLWDLTGIDLMVSQKFGTAQGFALRNHWFLERVMHDGARVVAWVFLGALVLLACLAKQPELRVSAWWAFGGTLLSILIVQWLKRSSASSCPWDLQMFGGLARYVSHWQFQQIDGGSGRCFPSGHASVGFCFLSAWVAVRRHLAHPLTALISIVSIGLILGMVQVLRGAHFVSHVLWSACVCAAVAVLMDVVKRKKTYAVS